MAGKPVKQTLFKNYRTEPFCNTDTRISRYLDEPDCSKLVRSCITGNDFNEIQSIKEFEVNDVVDQLFGMSPLLIATYFGRYEIVELLIEKEADIQAQVQKTHCRETAMTIAIFKNFPDIVTLLINNGYDISKPCYNKDNYLYNPLSYAFFRFEPPINLNIIKTLIEASDQSNIKQFLRSRDGSRFGDSPIVLIVKHYELDFIQYVIENCFIKPEELLMVATCHEKTVVVEYLMKEFKADPSHAQKNKNSPYKEAELRHYKEIVELMQNYGAVEQSLVQELLLKAVRCENAEDIERYLEEGADPNVGVGKKIDNHEDLPLFAALKREDDVDAVRVLLNNGAKDIPNWYGYYPLHYAVLNKRLKCVKLLLANGSNPNQKGCAAVNKSRTFFPITLCENLEILKVLVKNGADVNIIPYPENQTILFNFVLNNMMKCVKYLVEEKHVDINEKDCLDVTPLHLSVKHAEIVKYLIHHGACINVQARDGLTPLHAAVVDGTVESMLVLLMSGSNSLKSNFAETPLHLAAFLNFDEKAENILNYGVEINFRDLSGNAALHIASAKGNQETVECLLKNNKVNINLNNAGGATPLHLAAYNGHENVVKCLLSRGANSSILYDGFSAQQLCIKRGFFQLAQLFPESKKIPLLSCSSFQDFFTELVSVDGMGLCSYQSIVCEVLGFIEEILKCVGKKDVRFSGDMYLSGSFAERLKIGDPDEVDVILHLKSLSKHMQQLPIKKKFGYCELIKKTATTNSEEWDVDCFYFNGKISPNKLRAKLIEYIEDVFHDGEIKNIPNCLLHYFIGFDDNSPIKKVIEEHKAGCILNFNCRYGILATCNITVDIVPVLENEDLSLIKYFTSPSLELLDREKVSELDKNWFSKAYLIPSALENRENDVVWRYSTSHLETHIFTNIPHTQKNIYLIAKCLLKQFDNLELDGKHYNIPSYYLKTVFFRELVAHPDKTDWVDCKVLERVRSVFQNLKNGLETKLDSFFFKGHVLYDFKRSIAAQGNVNRSIATAIVSFLQSPLNVVELNLNPRSLWQELKKHFDFTKKYQIN